MIPELQPEAEIAAGLMERAVAFAVQGDTVRGNVATGGTDTSLGIVFVHGWSGYRHGPHGMLTFLARHLAAAGFPSLRFDFRGRGESGGNGLDASLPSMADDLAAASEWFATEYGVKGIVYVGLCSGGNVAIGSLKRLPLARALFLLSVYPFSDGDAFGRDVHRTWHYARVYLLKATRGETWTRLFKGDVHMRQVLNVLFGHFLRRGRNRTKEEQAGTSANETPQTAKPTAAESRNQGKEPPRTHLAGLKADLPAVMVYGTADPDAAAARRYYGAYAHEKGLPITFVDIEGANHNFSAASWKMRLADLARDLAEKVR